MANILKHRRYHFLYKTTNLTNGKFYYGMHSTNKLQDGYLGSGKYLRYAIKKYGVENFKLEILEFFDSREALVEAEKSLVTQLQVEDSNCMNLKPGGSGGFSIEACRKGGSKAGQVHKNKLQSDEGYRLWRSELSMNVNKRRKEAGTLYSFPTGHTLWVGREHRPETIEKMKQHKGKSGGSKNSQFGTKWITDEKENKKIKATDQIPEGWRAGRKIKK